MPLLAALGKGQLVQSTNSTGFSKRTKIAESLLRLEKPSKLKSNH